MTPSGFKPIIPASEIPHAHSLDREATGIGTTLLKEANMSKYELYLPFRPVIITQDAHFSPIYVYRPTHERLQFLNSIFIS
jgi:hypothetical protein